MSDVAIIGMACVFPGARDLETFWSNITNGLDAISDVPAARWDPVFYDPAQRAIDRLYCRRGGFVDAYARFDAHQHGVMPVATSGSEPDQLLTLEVAIQAMGDAGYRDRRFERGRAGVVIGRGNYGGAGRLLFEQHVRTSEQLVVALRGLLPQVSEDVLAQVKAEFQSRLPRTGVEAAIGLVPNLTASRIANRLDLHGPAFTIDAACASALVAVDHACRELDMQRCDLVIAGGVHLCHDESFWSVFCQLNALSREQQIRPFDRRADGILMGEGIGLVVLKRRIDAERDGDRIYAVIRGTGVASDGREASLMSPGTEGQLLALERAWSAADLEPSTIGLVEAHGTATPVGDAAELETLRRFFGPPNGTPPERRPGLGSVKSMIGHAMPAAGAAGLIKAALAAHHGVLPPTLHCEEPRDAVALTRFRILTQAEEWRADERRAAVNAFGFGGINAHVVLDGVTPRRAGRRRLVTHGERFFALAAESPEALLAALPDRTAETFVLSGAGPSRLVVLEPTPQRLALARTVVAKGRPWAGYDAIWFTPRGMLAEGELAFVFPGVDAEFRPRVDDLAGRFGFPLPAGGESIDAGRERADGETSPLSRTGAAIIGVNHLIDRVLRACGVAPDVVCGHSIGEWSAMIAADMLPEALVDEFIAAARGADLPVPDLVFAAAGCGREQAVAAMDGLPRLTLSHDNCPHQVILCGVEDSIEIAIARLQGAGVLVQKLPFQSGFHSPLFAAHVAPHRERFSRIPLKPPSVPLWSATTCRAYPDDLEAVRALAIEHLLSPVRFRELIETLYARGIRAFVQAGTGSLVPLIEDTLRGRPHLAVAANVHDRSGVDQLRRTLSALWVEGADVDFDKVWTRPSGVPVSLGVPLVRFTTPLRLAPFVAVAEETAAPPGGPLAAAMRGNLEKIARAQAEVLTRLAAAGSERSVVRRLSVETLPELRDHTFFRQPEGWPVLSDRYPVVPMTAIVALMVEEAATLAPHKVAIAVEHVRAFRWLAVASPVDARFHLRREGDRVVVQIEGHAEATVQFADAFPPAPRDDDAPLADAVAPPCTAERLYADRWMFHGPAYRGITSLSEVGSDGIRGALQTGAAKGALLDNAGQLFGFWIMLRHEVDRLAMPVAIERLRFFGPPPVVGERFACTVRVRRQEARAIVADLTLASEGRVWCRIEGWEDRRFETDARLWPVMQYPEERLLAEPRAEGWCWFADSYRAAATRDQLARRFLGERERGEYEVQSPRAQRSWLSGRIAAKDAVRQLLWRRGLGKLFPVEIQISNDADGRPQVAGAGGDVRVSIAHKEDTAVALAAWGRDPGIDLETVEARGGSFATTAFREEELALVAAEDQEEWVTRLWAAKEAAGKALGTGLHGDPRRLCVSERAGERLLVEGLWVDTRREGRYIVAWTVQP